MFFFFPAIDSAHGTVVKATIAQLKYTLRTLFIKFQIPTRRRLQIQLNPIEELLTILRVSNQVRYREKSISLRTILRNGHVLTPLLVEFCCTSFYLSNITYCLATKKKKKKFQVPNGFPVVVINIFIDNYIFSKCEEY